MISLSALLGYPLHTPYLISQWKQEEDLETVERGPIQGEHQEGKNPWEKLSWLGGYYVWKNQIKAEQNFVLFEGSDLPDSLF